MREPRSAAEPRFRTFWCAVPPVATPQTPDRATLITKLTLRKIRRDFEHVVPSLPRVRGGRWERDLEAFLDDALVGGLDFGWRLPLELCGYLRVSDPQVWGEAATYAMIRWFTMGDLFHRWMLLSCRDAGGELVLGVRRATLGDSNDVYGTPYEHVWLAPFAIFTGTSRDPQIPDATDDWTTFAHGKEWP